jgi:HlyD family secretion protein
MEMINPRRFTTGRSVLVAIAATALLLAGCQRAENQARFELAAIDRGDIAQRTTASGSLSAVISVDVGSQVSGKISSLSADFNDAVKKGQPLAEIDPTVYRASLTQARGELASATANVELKRANLKRKQALIANRATSQLELDVAKAELAQAEAALTIRRAAMETATANLGYCNITSPVDGIVIARKVDKGQTVIAAMSTPVLFTIAQDITRMHINTAVSEADIGRVREKQVVTFTVDAFPDETFAGTVTQVRRTPLVTQNVVTYETIIAVENPDRKLFPGMTAEVSILVAEQRAVLRVPNAALRYTPPEDVTVEQIPATQIARSQRLVYLQGADGAVRASVIKVGITDGEFSEVMEGLSEGAKVITSTLSKGAATSGAGRQGPPPL